MYQFIIHPKNGEKLSIHSYRGKQLLEKLSEASGLKYQKAGASLLTEETDGRVKDETEKISDILSYLEALEIKIEYYWNKIREIDLIIGYEEVSQNPNTAKVENLRKTLESLENEVSILETRVHRISNFLGSSIEENTRNAQIWKSLSKQEQDEIIGPIINEQLPEKDPDDSNLEDTNNTQEDNIKQNEKELKLRKELDALENVISGYRKLLTSSKTDNNMMQYLTNNLLVLENKLKNLQEELSRVSSGNKAATDTSSGATTSASIKQETKMVSKKKIKVKKTKPPFQPQLPLETDIEIIKSWDDSKIVKNLNDMNISQGENKLENVDILHQANIDYMKQTDIVNNINDIRELRRSIRNYISSDMYHDNLFQLAKRQIGLTHSRVNRYSLGQLMNYFRGIQEFDGMEQILSMIDSLSTLHIELSQKVFDNNNNLNIESDELNRLNEVIHEEKTHLSKKLEKLGTKIPNNDLTKFNDQTKSVFLPQDFIIRTDLIESLAENEILSLHNVNVMESGNQYIHLQENREEQYAKKIDRLTEYFNNLLEIDISNSRSEQWDEQYQKVKNIFIDIYKQQLFVTDSGESIDELEKLVNKSVNMMNDIYEDDRFKQRDIDIVKDRLLYDFEARRIENQIIREDIKHLYTQILQIIPIFYSITLAYYGYESELKNNSLPFYDFLREKKMRINNPYALEILKKHYSILQNKLLEKIEHYLIFEGEDNYIDDILAELNDIVSINKHIERFQKMLLKMKTKELKLLMNSEPNSESEIYKKLIMNISDYDPQLGYFTSGLKYLMNQHDILKLITKFRRSILSNITRDKKAQFKTIKKNSNKLVHRLMFLDYKKSWVGKDVIKNRDMLNDFLQESNILQYTFGIKNIPDFPSKHVIPDSLIYSQLGNMYNLVNSLEKEDFLSLDKKFMLEVERNTKINTIVKNNKLIDKTVSNWIENPEDIVDLGNIYLQKVMKDVMLIKCPKCGQVLAVKGEGCMSMRCANTECPLYNPEENDRAGADNRICGYCLQDFSDGDDAHHHVQNCKYNPNKGSYFLSHPTDEDKRFLQEKYPDYTDSETGVIDTNTINQLRIMKIHNQIRKEKFVEFYDSIRTSNLLDNNDKIDILDKLFSPDHKFSLKQNSFETFLEGVGFHPIAFNIDNNITDSSQLGLGDIIIKYEENDRNNILSGSIQSANEVKVGGAATKSKSDEPTWECLICMEDITNEQRFPCICDNPICWACTISGQKTLWQGSEGFPRKDFRGLTISEHVQCREDEDKCTILCACAANNCPSVDFTRTGDQSYLFNETHYKDAYQIVKGLKSQDARTVWNDFIKLRCREYLRPVVRDLDIKKEQREDELSELFKTEYMRIKRENRWVEQLSGIFNIPMYFYPVIKKIIEETAYYGGNKLPRDYYFDPDKFDMNVIVNFWLADDWGNGEKKEFWTEFCKSHNLNPKYIIDNIVKLT